MPITGTPEPDPAVPVDADSLHTSWCHIEIGLHTRVRVSTTRRDGESYADFVTRHRIRVAHAEAANPPNCTEH
jgi:hypothetical protein